jgi:F-type H+-transporting ATPase subunit delta
MSIVVANRYARALADVVAQKGDYRRVGRELDDFAALYHQSLELREVFNTPAVEVEVKAKLLQAIAGRLDASSITGNFLRVLLAHYRMGLLPRICEAFQKIANDRLGVVQVKVTSAAALSQEEQHALQIRFSELTGKQVELEYALDRDLLGGVRAQIGSTVYDGSIRGQLERIRRQLTAQQGIGT